MSDLGAGAAGGAAPVVVVGGGVVGLCCARSLARRGAAVVVLERGAIGQGASFGNAGTVSPGHPPINAPGRWRELIRSVIDPLSPLYIPPRLDPALWRWLVAFARHCSRRHVAHCRDVMAPLARATPDLHDAIAATAGGAARQKLGYRSGYLEVYRTQAGGRAAAHEAEFARGQGLSAHPLTGDELREREPALSAGVQGGFAYPESRTVDPHAFLGVVAADARRHGADVRENAAVTGVRTEDRRTVAVRTTEDEIDASAVILATGAYASGLYRDLGCPLPVIPAKGYHVDLPLDEPGTPRPETACLLVETSVFCTPMPGRLRLAGTLEFSGVDHRLNEKRLRQLTAGARPYLHDLGRPRPASRWCGLRPCTPDGLPVIGPLPGIRGVYAATGHAMLGLTFGPITGELIADLVLDGRSSLPIEPLLPARFV